MPQFTKRYRLIVLLGLASIFALVLVGRWLNATKRGGQGPAEPFRIAGNLYYVGATDAAAFLITGPEGHIVLDGGYPSTAPMIIASIAKLGFSIKDVRVLLNSEPVATENLTVHFSPIALLAGPPSSRLCYLFKKRQFEDRNRRPVWRL